MSASTRGPLHNPGIRAAERELSDQAEVAYSRTAADWQPGPEEKGRRRDTGARI